MGVEDKERVWEWNQILSLVVDCCVYDMVFEELIWWGSGLIVVVGWDGILLNGDFDVFLVVLVRELLLKGVGCGDGICFVFFCFEKLVFVVVVLLVIFRIGVVFVLLDLVYLVECMREIVRDCDVKFILCFLQFESICFQVVDIIVFVDLVSVKSLFVVIMESVIGELILFVYLFIYFFVYYC